MCHMPFLLGKTLTVILKDGQSRHKVSYDNDLISYIDTMSI